MVRARPYSGNVRSAKSLAQEAFVFELDPNRAQRVLLAKSGRRLALRLQLGSRRVEAHTS
jgi:hypothetical protein